MVIGVPKETFPGARRVALTPHVIPSLVKAGLTVMAESGCGQAAGFPDEVYTEKGARIAASRQEVFGSADIVVQIHALGANPAHRETELPFLRSDQLFIGLMQPLEAPEAISEASKSGVSAFALELIPRIARAQQMDVLSAMATVAGYKAVLLAAERLPKFFPLLMTAAGTVSPAHVLIVGAGVAGLMAIATARRLGAVVHAYDVRPAVAEQIESLGAKFVRLPLETEGAEDKEGYARALSDDMQQRQRDLLSKVVATSDVVITTAQVPGQRAPLIITEEMVAQMSPGSVIVDLAAENGGNCALTRLNEAVDKNGVTILGPGNLPATIPYHASQMFAKNVTTFVQHIFKKGELKVDRKDEIVQGTLVTQGGQVVHAWVREKLGLPPTE